MIGKLDDKRLLAGVGMGNMLFNILGFSFFIGLNGTLEAFIPQTLGSGKKRECGVCFNRAKIMNLIIFVPLAIIMCFTEELLLLCSQDAEISHIAMIYCVFSLPGLLAIS